MRFRSLAVIAVPLFLIAAVVLSDNQYSQSGASFEYEWVQSQAELPSDLVGESFVPSANQSFSGNAIWLKVQLLEGMQQNPVLLFDTTQLDQIS